MRITVYLDDGLGSPRDFGRCEAASLFVKTSLQLSGFLPNDSNSIWQPTSSLVWLGYCIDLAIHTISIPSDRILSVVQVIDQFVLSMLLVLLENWPSLSVRLFQRVSSLVILLVSHFDILRSPTWDDKISLSRSTLNELCFWKESIPFLNS